jgi:hypothetical protein
MPMQPVEYSEDNVNKCWCGQCPVQKESSCAKDGFQEASKDLEQHKMPDPKDMPGLYCSTGKATCDDLKPVERCLCSECLVWGEHTLPANHYCVQGSATQLST